MDEETFRKQTVWMSFILCILVILTHAENAELFLGTEGTSGAAAFAEVLIGEKISQIAVPGFFMISSLQFFHGYTPAALPGKWKRRVRSVLIPYFLWNALYYFGYVIASRLPGLSEIVGKGTVTLSFGRLLQAMIDYSYNYVFWFVFQLILLILLSPLLYYAVKNFTGGLILCAFLLAAVLFRIRLSVLNADACFYYTFAAWLSFRGRTENRTPDRQRDMLRTALFLAAAGAFLYAGSVLENDLFTVLGRTAGVCCLWAFLCILRPGTPENFMRNSFAIYAAHFALVRLINKAAARALFGNEAAALVIYFLMPVIVISVVTFFCGFGRKHLPKLYSLFSGNR